MWVCHTAKTGISVLPVLLKYVANTSKLQKILMYFRVGKSNIFV